MTNNSRRLEGNDRPEDRRRPRGNSRPEVSPNISRPRVGSPLHSRRAAAKQLWVVGRLGGWLCGFLRTFVASASPRSRIVCNRFWDLSRRERCLDKSQNLLRAAWIGVMQKNWIPQKLPRGCGFPPGWAVTQSVESPLQFVQRLPVTSRVSPKDGLVQGPATTPPTIRDQSTRPRTQAAATHRTRRTNESRHLTDASRPPLGPSQTSWHCPSLIQFFCITPIQAALNGFWGLSRHLSRLDKPQKPLHTIWDRGDAEAPSVRTGQTANHQAAQRKHGDRTTQPNRSHTDPSPHKSCPRVGSPHHSRGRPAFKSTLVKPPKGGPRTICGQLSELWIDGLTNRLRAC
jgi:hypothetical protein